ncbi:unnamed protein product [Cylicocyclus nassatus]|uniref:DUF3106 domain-containing protein n=1 Tax=Cylicocyclus nassatus TaxID=53992 RepID=A0AA36DPT2_CYLNA|nr:unnamed protein product [Cylicocyclus nassatus]
MLKILVFLALVMVAARRGWTKKIPGVSAANMEKLHQIMSPRPHGLKEFERRFLEWENSLPPAEKAAAQAYREQWHNRYRKMLEQGIPGVSAASMTKLRQMMEPLPERMGAFLEKMHEWMNSLPPEDKKAAEAYREQIRQRHAARRAFHHFKKSHM